MSGKTWHMIESGLVDILQVEKLFNVYCSVLSDDINNGGSLLKLATSNTYRNDNGVH